MTAEAVGGDVLDAAALERLRATVGDDGFVNLLAAAFLDEAPQLLAALRQGVGAGDAKTVRRTAHTLKTNAMTFGVTGLTQAARELESAARGSIDDRGAQLLARVEREYDRGQAALRTVAAV